MKYLLLILVSCCLSIIVYQDIKYKAIPIYCFIILSISCFFVGIFENTFEVVLLNIAEIFLLIVTLGFSLFVYYANKNKKITKIIDEKLGSGDVLFSLSVAWMFSLFSFLLFFLTSLFFSLICYSLRLLVDKGNSKDKYIPLAGLQSLYLLLIIIINELLLKQKYSFDIAYFADNL